MKCLKCGKEIELKVIDEFYITDSMCCNDCWRSLSSLLEKKDIEEKTNGFNKV
jgi:DNA-directed RNA polymerase subunit RPC12/RpoP